MMRSFHNISIRSKLIVVIMATCSIALLLGGVALTARYAATEQEKMANRMLVLAEVIGANSTAAVSFDDPVEARATLAALAAESSILAARVYLQTGELFARYSTPQAAQRLAGVGDKELERLSLGADVLSVTRQIILDGEVIGRVVIDADLHPLRVGLMRDVAILTLIMLVAGLLVLPLSSKLQRIVSEPISRLARTMRHVSLVKDYGVHVQKHGDDEVGMLIDGFNEMLQQIRSRDEQLRIAANALESTGDAIMITDARLWIVSVNRSFSTMTGYVSEAVVGERPFFLHSKRHGKAFFKDIRRLLDTSGQWHGELWGRRDNGEEFPQWLTISEIRDQEGQLTHYVFVSNDISQQKQYEESLKHMAHHDALTKLPNRILFDAELRNALLTADRNNSSVALMFIDLDKFKTINDALGHAAGDRLLQTVATRLKDSLRECDLVGRRGGDEFTVLLYGVDNKQHAATVAGKLLSALTRPMELAGQRMSVTASIGISCFPEDAHDAARLVQCADEAMYLAKQKGRNNYQIHASRVLEK